MTDTELARELGAVVLGVDGVLQSYDARPALVAAVTDAAAAVLRTDPAEPVVVSRSADGVSVRVRIAVSEARPASDTCREVYSAVLERLEAWPAVGDRGVASIAVEVSRIG